MVKKLLFSALLMISMFIEAQITNDTILYEGKISASFPLYIINNGVYCKWQWNKLQKKYLFFKDTVLQNSFIIDKSFNMKSYFIDKQLNFIYIGNENSWTFDLNGDSLIACSPSLKFVRNFTMTDYKAYYSDYSNLYIHTLNTRQIIDSFNIEKEFPEDVIFGIIKFSNSNNIFMALGNYDGGEINNEKYYVYDEANKNLILSRNNDLLKKNIEPNSFGIKFYDFSGKYVFVDDYIIDFNYNIFSKINYFHSDIYGLVIASNKIKQIVLKSNLDTKDGEKDGMGVLILYVPNPFREKAMYEICENIKLKSEDLKQLDVFDLKILRNAVFAKYNYAFKDKFLQAYFNLYSFYGRNHNKKRIADVNNLLTPMDKKNLELIQQISKSKTR